MKKKLNIAVLDNGVYNMKSLKFINNSLEVDNDNSIKILCDKNNPYSFYHGEYCCLIIHRYCPNCVINSIRILNANGRGLITNLKPALQWCIDNNISVVNLSLGTIHFKDKNKLQKIINFYTSKGLIIIAASSNNGYTTYPASFSNVIGVESFKSILLTTKQYKILNDIHKGIDFLAPSTHKINHNDFDIITEISNSYATPFITATIINMISNYSATNIFELKLMINKNFLCYNADWIYKAYVDQGNSNSNAIYYFIGYKNCDFNSIKEIIDTVIIYDSNRINYFINSNKKIIYLGNDDINQYSSNILWKKSNKIKQIELSLPYNKDLDIPIILIKYANNLDEYYILQQLESLFYNEGYNIYPVSFNIESILFNINYIPLEFSTIKKINTMKNFLYGEIYYKRCDSLILSISNINFENSKELINTFSPDIIINFNIDFINISDGELNYSLKYNSNPSFNVIKWLYIKTLELLKN